MSQHDFDIANQIASNTRADLNLALKALASNSSGVSAPSTTYANMIYYNTSNNTFYKRNEADSAWISLGIVDETAGTFTQSGERSVATLAQAQAGTDNTTVMTPLRVSNAISSLVSTTTVLDATAAATQGAVGTYAYLISNANSDTSFGGTVAGSTLFPAGTSSAGNSTDPDFGDNNSGNSNTQNSARSGTWRCMGKSGYYTTGTGERGSPVRYFYGATLWLRIS